MADTNRRNADVYITVDVEGGGNPYSPSANLIRNSLSSAFNKVPAAIAITANKNSAAVIRSQLQKEFNRTPVVVDVTLNSAIDTTILSRSIISGAKDIPVTLTIADNVLQSFRTKIENELQNISVNISGNVNGTTGGSGGGGRGGGGTPSANSPNRRMVLMKRDQVNSMYQLFEENKNVSQYAEATQLKDDLETLFNELLSSTSKPTAEQMVRLTSLMRDFRSATAGAKKEVKELGDAAKKAPQIAARARLELASFEKYLKTLKPKAVAENHSVIDMIRSAYNSNDEEQIERASTLFKEFQANMKLMGNEGGNIMTLLHDKLKSFFTYLVSSTSLTFLVSEMRKVIATAIELDGALTDLRIVTGGTVAQTEQLIDTYVAMAKKLGTTTMAVSEAAVEWQRQGYNIEETNKLVEDSMVLSVVGMVESAEAAQYLTSAIKGYNVSVNEASLIVDRLTAVDMKAAVSAGGLAEAMARTANSARQAGVDMDSLLGYIAAVGEVTQRDMATVGEAFKTIFARYGNVKLGKLTDDDGESLNDFERALSAVGLALRDQSGQFRDFDDVMKELGERYETLSDVERSAIATTLGGVRQRENVLVLMENLDKAYEYTELSSNSAGTAMEKFGVYEESVEHKTQKLAAAFEEMSLALVESGWVKILLSGATAVVELVAALPELVRNIGLLAATFTTLGTAWNMFRNSTMQKAFTDLIPDLGWLAKTSDIVPISYEKAA